MLGMMLSRWHALYSGMDMFIASLPMPAVPASAPFEAALLWWGCAAIKTIGGVLAIFTWRILAKATLHAILPPIFRFLSQSFVLPHRRFYIPATDYTDMPQEKGLDPIPSVIDLPGTLHASSTAFTSPYAGRLTGELKQRSGAGTPRRHNTAELEKSYEVPAVGPDDDEAPGKHYDADGQWRMSHLDLFSAWY